MTGNRPRCDDAFPSTTDNLVTTNLHLQSTRQRDELRHHREQAVDEFFDKTTNKLDSLEDVQAELIKAQSAYIEASRDHIALLAEGISHRDITIAGAGSGFPISYKHNPYDLAARTEKASAEQLAVLAKRMDELSAIHSFLRRSSLTKDLGEERNLKCARRED
ncbi:hypothetical protein A1Q1_00602 [Trichosporon asahii var. asahii CBS 2479]|uniref:Uncharacterized protein n=1 Tax=Trichosporon asahii var. asahii (strain ATCC 90039 / CBS 2479 / JCM 2466 / KCTC 7840 / NBRC 103889/ NCYC 2677 / UAMH 7654) TaxID=1186058 RepID=J4UFI6_TRIAS|nr:hypothetical protein A1Q1_00602 [Trichosporon asahii var. asahii CBS 2479]EJT50135.1 hypothetical protein A1Q1_00602 [Trichosporon asahii var. asahii CBS 2479]